MMDPVVIDADVRQRMQRSLHATDLHVAVPLPRRGPLPSAARTGLLRRHPVLVVLAVAAALILLRRHA